MTYNQKRLIKIIIGSIFFGIALIWRPSDIRIYLGLFLVGYFVVGGEVLLRAFKNILKGQVFDEHFLMCIATVGAFIIGEYPEGLAVMLFYQIGELFQSHAVSKSRKSISTLMDIRPDYANVETMGSYKTVDPEDVSIGDIIMIKPGEKVPLDAVVIEGHSSLDTSALTGESIPREVSEGVVLLSGCININGMIKARVLKEFGESTASKILDLVENASSKKSKSEKFITKFAKYYTPSVVIIAAVIAFIPPVILNNQSLSEWVSRALVFLVVSCPCALVISVPLSFFGGIGAASRMGILVKGSNYLEALARVEMVVFDKTGTLTKGVFKVQEIKPKAIDKHELLKVTAYAEGFSDHPISKSIKKAYGKEIDTSKIRDVKEYRGYGVNATIEGRNVLVGNKKLMDKMNVKNLDIENRIGTIVHIAIEGTYVGHILIADELKDDAKQAIVDLKNIDIKQTTMLTGDTKHIGEMVANNLKIDKVYTELLPGDKVDKFEEILKNKKGKETIAFVGDGINDAPVLARADVGIAMGGLGSDAAIEAADIVIMTDEPSRIPIAVKISKKTIRIVKQNIVFALGVKALVLVLGALGIASMWSAVFADVGVSVIAILNAIRVLNVKEHINKNLEVIAN